MFEGLTYYVVKPFFMTGNGIKEGASFEVANETAGGRCANTLNDKFVGFILFSRTRCLITGQYMDAVILGGFGVLPHPHTCD